MEKRQLDIYKDAYQSNFRFHAENILTLNWYVQKIIKRTREIRCRSMLSLGIGHRVVSSALVSECEGSLGKYTIVEGSAEIIREFTSDVKLPSNVHIVNDLFEEFKTDEKFDAIEMGFVLEHVEDPLAIVKRYQRFLGDEGLFFIAVPNAKSLHRQIGYEAGILSDFYELGSGDLELGHKRYFDLDSLLALVRQAGLKVNTVEGILLKPFSAAQLQALDLSPVVIKALLAVGDKYPEIANSIYFEASLQQGPV